MEDFKNVSFTVYRFPFTEFYSNKLKLQPELREKGGHGAGELRQVMGEVRRANSIQVVKHCVFKRHWLNLDLEQGQKEKEERWGRGRHRYIYGLAHGNRGLCRVVRAFVP